MSYYGSAASQAASDILPPLSEFPRRLLPCESGHSSLQQSQMGEEDPRWAELEVLGKRCKDGDVAAWDSLFKIAWPLLVKFVNRLYRSFDEQDAEDVAQASMEAAINSIRTFSGKGLFRGWLLGIASKQAGTLFRKRSAKKRGMELQVPFDRSVDTRDGRAKSPADASEESDRAAILHRAIEELDEVDRDLVHLHFFGELTFKQISEARNIKPKTVCTRLTRCKAKLLALLVRSNLTSSNG
jgi:RNA polymerase sigma factor (sigma-70 family)